ncbi:pyridoxal 5'-phosphate synthase, glutaminase subunit Pdx2 [Pneumocystis murina B123]|uniref:glutaminase n=1 Tax=Pneumocystis murina (strain B123) TaxID=1069680 RepID=M7NR93_PNEMU|nr:pyridoxal 5'-phosphate synthase, glutaminase subunit Pdx2 [Pneumocystis murina B123]EMR11243.1 pyridoxal 5'-phosphate synthase, glutaminase subunit Pdx2 [Pneumocystis murina B123]
MSVNENKNINVGVLALQGAFYEHYKLLKSFCFVNASLVRNVADLSSLHGLIIPGGESTTIGYLLSIDGLGEEIKARVKNKSLSIWGTCAGMILLAKKVEGMKKGGQYILGCLDIVIKRNYFGRQINSFSSILSSKVIKKEFLAVFIRAPVVLSIISPNVSVLATINKAGEDNKILESGAIVAVQQDNILATSFHPELSNDNQWHEWWLNNLKERYKIY